MSHVVKVVNTPSEESSASTSTSTSASEASPIERRLWWEVNQYFKVPANYIAFYKDRVQDILRDEGDDCHVRMQCPFESEVHTSPPLRLNTISGAWFCHACSRGGHVGQWWTEERKALARANGEPEPSTTACLTELLRLGPLGHLTLTDSEREYYQCLLGEHAGSDAQNALARDEQEIFTQHVIQPEEIEARRESTFWCDPYFINIFRAFAARGISRDLLFEVGAYPHENTYFRACKFQPAIHLPFYSSNGFVAGVKAMCICPTSGAMVKEYLDSSRAHLLDIASIARRPRDLVILVEGELDALLLRARGWCATSGSGGCGTFPPHFTNYFRDRDVAVVYDADNEGQSGAAKVLRKLEPVVRSVVSINLYPSYVNKDRKDITDFLIKDGRTDEEFLELIQQSRGQ